MSKYKSIILEWKGLMHAEPELRNGQALILAITLQDERLGREIPEDLDCFYIDELIPDLLIWLNNKTQE